MQNITTKSSGSIYTSSEFNSSNDELKNLITSSGQTLNSSSVTQIGQSAAIYSMSSSFYTDSGTTNTYTLTRSTSLYEPAAYLDGMEIRFFTNNANTGASTVSVGSLGSINILRSDGSVLEAGDINSNKINYLIYNAGNFYLVSDVVNFALKSQAIGINQTFQDVSASRTAGVNYINNTGKPINISIYFNYNSSLGFVGIFIDGVQFATTGDITTDTLSAIVPDGSTYSLTPFNINDLTIFNWNELR